MCELLSSRRDHEDRAFGIGSLRPSVEIQTEQVGFRLVRFEFACSGGDKDLKKSRSIQLFHVAVIVVR